MRSEFNYPPMLIVVIFTLLGASYFHLGLGWVVLMVSPLALALAWKKADKS